MDKITLDTITLTILGKKVELTPDQARKLKSELAQLFPEPVSIPWFQPIDWTPCPPVTCEPCAWPSTGTGTTTATGVSTAGIPGITARN